MIELLILDVDGTMTNGKITYTNSGEELKSFCVKDGLAIATWKKMGRKVAIITGRESKIVENRAKELKVDYLVQNCKDKLSKADEILKQENIDWSRVAVVGDDLNDYNMLKASKLSFVPKDGSYILDNVAIRLSSMGGNGAIREAIEYILKSEGKLEEFINIWLLN